MRNKLDQKRELMQKDFFHMLSNISQGLLEIHSKKIIHRDIKPENIVLKNGIYKITDFGVSMATIGN